MPKDDEDNLVLRLLEKMRIDMAAGFGRLGQTEGRLARFDERFARIDERFDRIDLRVADLHGLVLKTFHEVVSISRRVETLESTRLSKIEAEVEAMQIEIAALKVAKQGGA